MDAAYMASLGEQNMCYSLPELLKPGCLWVIRTPGVYRLSGRRGGETFPFSVPPANSKKF